MSWPSGPGVREDEVVLLQDVPAVDVRPTLRAERGDLLDLLSSLTADEWLTLTAAPGWTVKDVALHLLDDDLGWLSRGRDGDSSGLLQGAEQATFIEALAAKNQAWVTGARGLSLPVVTGLLKWSGRQMDDYNAELDLTGQGEVTWASDDAVPVWFDLCQDLTERWVHQMQMREALARVDTYAARYLPLVLRTFVWAFPHQYGADAPAGTTVELDLSSGGTWTLTSDGSRRWALDAGAPAEPAATATFSDDAGWRSLTAAPHPRGGVVLDGPARLVEPLLDVRGILV